MPTLKRFAAYAAALGCILLLAAVVVHVLMKHEYAAIQSARLQIMAQAGEDAVEETALGKPIAPQLARVLVAPDEGLAWLDPSGKQIARSGLTSTADATVYSVRVHEPRANGTMLAMVANTRIRTALRQLDIGLAIGSIVATIIGGAIITLIAARAMASVQRALQRMYRFTGDAAHELRTPLAVITSNADLLAMGVDDEGERNRSLANIREAAGQMRALMDGLLILARADEGVIQDLYAIDLVDCLESVVDLYRGEAAAHGLTVRMRKSQPGQTIYGRPEQVTRMVGNLIENAVRYTPSGGSIEIASSVERSMAVVEISDTGVGMDAAVLDRVFDRFWRGRPASGNGFGLGLPIARALARAHGGDLSVRSRPGAGSTFTLSLPLRPVRIAAPISTVS